jgi:hypothetical protein
MLELFGEMPLDLLHIGKNSSQWFTAEGFIPSIHHALDSLN